MYLALYHSHHNYDKIVRKIIDGVVSIIVSEFERNSRKKVKNLRLKFEYKSFL